MTPRPSSPQSPGDGDLRLAADLRRALVDRGVGDVGQVGDQQVDSPRRARGCPRRRSPRASMPSRAAFSRATSAASGERSEAVTRRSGRSLSRARAIAPEPVPTSCTRAPSRQLDADGDQQLGLAARDQHPLVDGDLDLAEAAAAEDVLERLALGAAGDAALDLRRSSGLNSRRSRRARASSASIAQRIGDQRLGVRFAASRSRRRRSPLGRLLARSPLRSPSASAPSIRASTTDSTPLRAWSDRAEPRCDRLPCRRRTTRIQTAPTTIIARLSSCAVVSPRAASSLRRRNSTRKRSAPA